MIESEMQFEVACQSKKVYSVIQVFLVLSVFPFFLAYRKACYFIMLAS